MESKIVQKFKCEICEKSFSSKNKSKHMNIVHGEKKKIDCNVCSRVFENKPALKGLAALRCNQTQGIPGS